MVIDIVSKEDLEVFRIKLLEDLKKLIQPQLKEEKTKWLKSWEVMKMLGISKGTLQNLRIQRKLPCSKINGLLFYKLEDVEKLLNEGRR